ncbi:MAG: potassium-transporting ATPase subunit F [Mycobacterium sp.]
MFWFGVYVSAATVVALFVYLAAVLLRADRVGPSEHPVMTAVLTGMLWPALLVGVAELGLIWLCGRCCRSNTASSAEFRALALR